MKEWQVEFKIKGESGVYPYIVSAMTKEWAEQDAAQLFLRDFPVFNGKDVFTYKTICVNKGDIVEDTIDLIKQIYKKYSTGGALHIVLDDYNADDKNILWCLQNAIPDEEFCDKEDRKMFEQCAINLIKIDENRRKNVIKKAFYLINQENLNMNSHINDGTKTISSKYFWEKSWEERQAIYANSTFNKK